MSTTRWSLVVGIAGSLAGAQACSGGAGADGTTGDVDGGDSDLASPFCGNGIVDGTEACERELGCSATQQCTALCTCEDAPPAPIPSSQGLIEQALVDGIIDYPTSLQYRVWALFRAPQLPEAYDGGGTFGDDANLFLELSHARETLPPSVEAAIAPYLVRPTDPTSIYSSDPPPPPPGPPGPPAVCPATDSVRCPDDELGNPDWRTTVTAHFVVWSCGLGVAAEDPYGPRRTIVGEIAEQAFNALDDYAVPVGDLNVDGPAPTSNIDIYLLSPNLCRCRAGQCITISGDALAAALPVAPCGIVAGGGQIGSSGYLMLDISDIPSSTPALDTPSEFRSNVLHELFHVVSYGMNFAAQGGRCLNSAPYGAPRELKSWLTEASAEWTSFAFFPDDWPARRDELFGTFQSKRDRMRDGLHETREMLPYEAWLYPLFVCEENGGSALSAGAFMSVWTTSQAARNRDQFDAHLDTKFSFQDHFRDFAVRNVNRDLAGLPATDISHAPYDGALEFDKHRARVLEPALQLRAPAPTMQLPLKIAPLSAHYEHFTVHDGTRHLKIDIGKVGNVQHLSLDVLAKVDDTWKRVRPAGSVVEFCREQDGSDVSEIFMVVSNFDHSRTGLAEGDYEVRTATACPGGWSGTITAVVTLETHSFETFVEGSETRDTSMRDVHTWTATDTALVLPPGAPAGFEQEEVTMRWSANRTLSEVITNVYTPCGVSTDTRSGSGGGSATSVFVAGAGGPGAFMVFPRDVGHTYDMETTSTFESCEGVINTSVTNDELVEDITMLISVPEFLPMHEDAEGSGHFVGSAVFLHNEIPLPGGSEVQDWTLSWDLTRTPL